MAPNRSRQEWFSELCGVRRTLWDVRITELLGDDGDAKLRLELEAQFASNARSDLLRLEAEINLMVVRTAAILTAATLLFATYALKLSLNASGSYLSIALCLAGVGLVASLVPLTPPIIRALFKPYELRHEWTLLVHDSFTCWVMDCYLGKRRQDVLTKYKRAHAVAMPILVAAAAVMAVGMVLNLFQ